MWELSESWLTAGTVINGYRGAPLKFAAVSGVARRHSDKCRRVRHNEPSVQHSMLRPTPSRLVKVLGARRIAMY
jgi:hypothetical protein